MARLQESCPVYEDSNDKGDMESLGEYIRNLSCYEDKQSLDTENPVIDAL